jgi:hypothetical protein
MSQDRDFPFSHSTPAPHQGRVSLIPRCGWGEEKEFSGRRERRELLDPPARREILFIPLCVLYVWGRRFHEPEQEYLYKLWSELSVPTGPVLEQNRHLTISKIGLCMYVASYVCVWQYDDWSMQFMCWSLIGQNKFTLQTSADARLVPGGCTVQYKKLIICISVQWLE